MKDREKIETLGNALSDLFRKKLIYLRIDDYGYGNKYNLIWNSASDQGIVIASVSKTKFKLLKKYADGQVHKSEDECK